MFVHFFNVEIKEAPPMQSTQEHRVDRIEDRLNYWRARQKEIEAERPQTPRGRVEKRKAVACCAEEILRLERRLGAVEVVTYRTPRAFQHNLENGSLKKSVTGGAARFDCEMIGGDLVDVVSFMRA